MSVVEVASSLLRRRGSKSGLMVEEFGGFGGKRWRKREVDEWAIEGVEGNEDGEDFCVGKGRGEEGNCRRREVSLLLLRLLSVDLERS